MSPVSRGPSRTAARLLGPAAALALVGCGPTLPPSFQGELPEPPLPEQDPALPDALALVRRHLELSGVGAAIEGSRSVRLSGRAVLPEKNLEGEFEVLRARPSHALVTLWFPTLGESSMGTDGNVAWRLDPLLGASLIEGAELVEVRATAPYDHLVRRPEGLERLVTVGRERFEGHACYEVVGVYAPPADFPAEEVPPASARSFREYYDVESGLLAGSVTYAPAGADGAPGRVTRVFEDYDERFGVLAAARHVQRTPNGTLVLEVDEVEYDDVPEDAFALPPEVEELLAADGAGRR